MSELVAKVLSFKGDDETRNSAALLDVTESKRSGDVEAAFDHGKERIYLRFQLPELIAKVMEEVRG